jgi:SAM-dependent methyltransferase
MAPAWLRRIFRRLDLAPRVALTRSQPGKRVLDVGCATGEFLVPMRAAGWTIAGVEPTRWAADAAASHGLPVWPTVLADARLPEAAFDVATMWDVVEHLDEPGADLRRIHRALRPGGRLILTTPVLDGWEARLFGERWPGWDAPRHLTLFTRARLSALLEESGFAARQTSPHGDGRAFPGGRSPAGGLLGDGRRRVACRRVARRRVARRRVARRACCSTH